MTDAEKVENTEGSEDTEEKTEKVEAPKPLMIWEDSNGNVLDAHVRGKGRPPEGVVKDAEGNSILRGCTLNDKGEILTPKQQVTQVQRGADGDPISYITLDENGEEISREKKGRGRPRNGFEKIDDESHALNGHWVMVQEPEQEEETPEVNAKDDTNEVDASDADTEDADAEAAAAADAEAAGVDLSGLESGLDTEDEDEPVVI